MNITPKQLLARAILIAIGFIIFGALTTLLFCGLTGHPVTPWNVVKGAVVIGTAFAAVAALLRLVDWAMTNSGWDFRE